jgi:hypothetical protein
MSGITSPGGTEDVPTGKSLIETDHFTQVDCPFR